TRRLRWLRRISQGLKNILTDDGSSPIDDGLESIHCSGLLRCFSRSTGGETMNKQRLVSGVAISTISLLGLLLSSSIYPAGQGSDEGRRANEVGSMGPVPKAVCGRSDHAESGLQGQTTSAERAVVNGHTDSERGYNCNLELVGKFQGEGAFSQDGP